MTLCPYPAPTCESNKELDFGSRKTAFCEDCYNLSFSCEKCGESNRSLASFCRKCGKEISLPKVETEIETEYAVTATDLGPANQIFDLPLNVYGLGDHLVVRPFLNLCAIMSENGRGLLTNLNSPVNPIFKYDLSKSGEVAFPPVFHRECLFIFTTRSILVWNLMSSLAEPGKLKTIFSVNEKTEKFRQFAIYKSPIVTNDHIFLLLGRPQSQGITDVKCLFLDRTGDIQDEADLEEHEELSSPILADDQGRRIFFHSRSKIYFVELKGPKIGIQVRSAAPHELIMSTEPRFNFPLIYVPGKDHIYTLNIESDELVLERFIETPFSYKFINDGLDLFIAKSAGAGLARMRAGFHWDSSLVLPNISGPSYGFYPVRYDGSIGFVSKERKGHLFSMVRLGDQISYLFRHEFAKILAQPVIYNGLLFLIHQDSSDERIMSVFKL
jgi:hypothetical protein